MKKIKKVFLAIFSALMICSSIVPVVADINAEGNAYDTIILEYDFPIPNIEKVKINNEYFDRIKMGVLPNSCDVDTTSLPVKPLKVLLPYGRVLDTVDVVVENGLSLGVGFNVEKGQNIIPILSSESIENNFVEDFDFNNQLFTIVGTYVFRGYTILFVNLHPVQYKEDSGELIWYKHITLQVKTQPTSENRIVRNRHQDKEIVMKQVVNPQVLETYNDAKLLTPLDLIEYVIITNEELKNAAGAYTFQDLVTAKQNNGMTVDIFTVEDIIANQDYWVNGLWGDNNPSNPFYNGEIQGPIAKFNDTPAKIRNFIRYAYTELGTEYVLLGGDADYTTSDNIVPLRKLFAVEDGLPLGSRDLIEEDIPSDVYYACLDGNFNRDGDDHWGENATQNGYNDEDEADLLSEVYVGRACVDADNEVSNFVMKTLGYEASADPYIFTGLMVGESLGFPGVSAYGGNYKDLIIPLFPESYVVDTLYDRDGTWSKSQLMNLLNTNTPHIINHLGHGNVQYALKMGVSDIASLTNNNYFFIYSQTCLAGSFDNSGSDCAAEYFTVETSHGAFAVIMNARYGLGSENTLVSPSQVLDESFFTALFTENLRALGQANHYSKEDHIWQINENGIRWVYYETNLFGDPALKIKPCSNPPEIPDQPSGPTEGIIYKDYVFETKTTEPDGDKIFYKFNWGDNTTSVWLGPYNSGETIDASHQWSSAGNYNICVKARDDNNSIDTDWSEPLGINIYDAPAIDINMIKGGFLGVSTKIVNKGGCDASAVKWNITFEGGLIFMGKSTTDEIPLIKPGENVTINSKPLIGFGKTKITVTAEIDLGISDSRSQNGIMLLFFTKVIPGG